MTDPSGRWDPGTKDRLARLQGEGRGVRTVAFSAEGTTLAAGTEDGKVALWDVSEWRVSRLRRLVVVAGDSQRGPTGEPLDDPLVVEARDQYGNPLPGIQVTFTVTEGGGKLGRRFTLEKRTTDANGRAEAVLALGPIRGANIVKASVPGIEVVSFRAEGVGESVAPTMEGDFHTWHLPDGAIASLGKGAIGDLEYSPNGDLLAVGSGVGIWLYDVATAREVALLPGRAAMDIAFSPDGTRLASCAEHLDKIRIWEVATGDRVASIDHQAEVLAFSPDGRTLASGSDFGIELWDVGTWTQRAAMSEAEGIWGIRSVDFSPDGRTLAAGSWWDNTVQFVGCSDGYPDRNVPRPQGSSHVRLLFPGWTDRCFRVGRSHGQALGRGHRIQCRHL